MSNEIDSGDLKVDSDNLYREEIFTDRAVGTIRQLVPVTSDGATDDKRQVLYIGQAQLLTPLGAIPLSFEIDAASLSEATENFPRAAKVAVDQAAEEMRELRRQAASSIVVPEAGAGLGTPGGLPGSGKIKLP